MNVKQFCQMIYKDAGAVTISIGWADEPVQKLNILDPFAMEMYSRFKVDSFRAMNADTYEINLAYTPAAPITED